MTTVYAMPVMNTAVVVLAAIAALSVAKVSNVLMIRCQARTAGRFCRR